MNIYFIQSKPFGVGQYKRLGLDFLQNHGISLKAINLVFLSQKKYTEDVKKNILNLAEKTSNNDIVFYHVDNIHKFIFNYVLNFLKRIKNG